MTDHRPALEDQVRDRALELGFDWFAAVSAGPLQKELEDLRAWLAEQRHGDMEWLARNPERRADPRQVVEGCRTVVIVGLNYQREPIPGNALEPPEVGKGRITKYALTRDYHRVMEKPLRKLCRFIDTEAAPGSRSRAFVDYGPVMERIWAERAELGFLGKHTLLIHPQLGSFHFLGSLLTTADLAPLAEPGRQEPFGCGDCRRCLDACPTNAITEPWKFDARRCLSYLTIEKDGPIERDYWPQFEGYLFGCDICQDVCPYNRSRAKPKPAEESILGREIVPSEMNLVDLLQRPCEILEQLEGTSSPLKRAGAESLQRNAAIVAATRGDQKSLEALEELAHSSSIPDWLRETFREAAAELRQKLGGPPTR